MPGSFFDSNIAVYAVGGEQPKAARAEALLAAGGTISVQVLNETANVALRKLGFTLPEVVDLLNRLRSLTTVVSMTIAVHERALRIRDRYGFAFYDCCIIAAALLAYCDILWSEDMHDGLVIDGRLTIRNPFA